MPDGAAAAAGGRRWSGGYGGPRRSRPSGADKAEWKTDECGERRNRGRWAGGGYSPSPPPSGCAPAVCRPRSQLEESRRQQRTGVFSLLSSPLSSFIRAHRLGVALHTTRPISRTRAARSARPCEPWCCRARMDSGALSDDETRLSLWRHVKTVLLLRSALRQAGGGRGGGSCRWFSSAKCPGAPAHDSVREVKTLTRSSKIKT